MRNTGLFVLLAGLAACGGSDAANGRETARATAGQDGAAESPDARSACELASEAEIGAIAGEAVSAKPGKGGPGYSSCEYWGAVSKAPVLGVTAWFRGGREAFEIYRSGMGMAADMIWSAEGVELDSIVQPGPVPGLGDAAVYAELVPSVVLDGDRYLELFLFYLPDAKAKFRPLSELLLSRM